MQLMITKIITLKYRLTSRYKLGLLDLDVFELSNTYKLAYHIKILIFIVEIVKQVSFLFNIVPVSKKPYQLKPE